MLMGDGLFGPDALSVNALLAARHYLGPSPRGTAYRDEYGALVFANPSSRRLPQQRWLELVRWCIVSDVPNAGSRQWRAVTRWLREQYPDVTTVVSYSDPSAGHTGALYRACNWLWAPTWHRLREPPSGNGYWTEGKRQAVKDRWVFCLRPDTERAARLSIRDASLLHRMPWAQFTERHGGDYRRWVSFTRRVEHEGAGAVVDLSADALRVGGLVGGFVGEVDGILGAVGFDAHDPDGLFDRVDLIERHDRESTATSQPLSDQA